MMHSVHPEPIAELSWLVDYLSGKGFQRTAPATFFNGRATLILQGTVLRAIPGEGSKVWRSELQGAGPDAVRELLDALLAAPSFWSQKELDRRESLRAASFLALARITDTIRQSPEGEGGRCLRRFLWSLYNQHHLVNLWSLRDTLETRGNTWVTEVFTAWTQGCISEDVLRRALTDSGEMDRWDTFCFQRRESDLLADALNAVTGLLKTIPPSAPVSRLARANQLLQEVRDCLRWVNPERLGEAKSDAGIDTMAGGGK